MKRSIHRKTSGGFTLLELMVAMSITALIVTVLVSITSIALDAWQRSRSEVRAARQAKAALETMAKDFESLLTRSGNSYEWLSARVEPELKSGGGGLAGPSRRPDAERGAGGVLQLGDRPLQRRDRQRPRTWVATFRRSATGWFTATRSRTSMAGVDATGSIRCSRSTATWWTRSRHSIRCWRRKTC